MAPAIDLNPEIVKPGDCHTTGLIVLQKAEPVLDGSTGSPTWMVKILFEKLCRDDETKSEKDT